MTQTTAKTININNGLTGVRDTLRIMRRIVKQSLTDYRIREQALNIVRYVPSKNWVAEINAIMLFIHNDIRYVKDVYGIETLATPVKTLEIGQGDCDDMVMLAAALLMSIGHPVRFLAVGFHGQAISHVLLETLIGQNWVPMELTECLPLGQYPNDITAKVVQHV